MKKTRSGKSEMSGVTPLGGVIDREVVIALTLRVKDWTRPSTIDVPPGNVIYLGRLSQFQVVVRNGCNYHYIELYAKNADNKLYHMQTVDVLYSSEIGAKIKALLHKVPPIAFNIPPDVAGRLNKQARRFLRR
jgi:hypothetical protein